MTHKATILAVDDDPESLRLLTAMLTAAGYDVRPDGSGELAPAAVAANPPDLILLDVHIKGMEGLEVCRLLKSREATRRIPILLISAFADVKEWAAGLQAGAADYVTKPFQLEELLARVTTHLALSRMNVSLEEQAAALRQASAQLESEIVQRRRVEDELRQTLDQTERSRRALLSTLEDQQQAEGAMRLSNERLRRFVDANVVGVVVADAGGAIVEANDYYLRLLGYTREELAAGAVDWRAVTPPEWLPADERALRELREEGVCTPYEKEYARPDGTRVPVFLADALLPEGLIAAFALDITQRKQAEEALRLAHERLRQFVDANIVGIMMNDADGVVFEANDYYLRLVGYTREELAAGAVDWRAITPPEWLPADEQALRELRERGECTPYEKEYARRDGTRVSVFLVDAMLPGGLIAAFALDITQRKQAEAEAATRSRQQEAIADLGRLALTGVELPAFLERAVQRIAQVLDVEFCRVLELLPDRSALLLRAGVGWKEGLVGRAEVSLGPDSQAGFVLHSKAPVIVEDLGTEQRFRNSMLLRDHGVVSSLSTIIGDPERPYGVLGVHTTRRRDFSVHDVHFLEGAAALLANAVQRRAHEAEIERMSRLYATLSQVNQAVVRCKSREELSQQLCRVVVEFGGFASARVSLRVPGSDRVIIAARRAAPDSSLPFPVQDYECGIIAEALHTGRPSLSNDAQAINTQDERTVRCRSRLAQGGIKSCAAFPVFLHGEVFGALSICSEEAGFFNPDEIQLLEEVSSDVSYALDHLDEEAQRRQAEENLRRQTAVTAAINRVLQGALQAKLDVDVARSCLSEAEQVTGSPFGWIAEMNPLGRLDTIALSNPGWDACRMPGAQMGSIHDFEIEGIFGPVMRDGISLIANEPGAHPDRVALPSGHPSLTALLGVPLKQNGRTIGMIALGNKPSGYGPADQEAVEALSVAFVEALQRKRTETRNVWLSGIVESTSNEVLTFDETTLRFTYANRGALDNLGFSLDELSAMTPLDLRPGATREKFEELAAPLRTGQLGALRFETLHRRKDGSTYPVFITLQRTKGESGPVFVAIGTNLTEVRAAQEAMEASEARYRALFENHHTVMLVIVPETGAIVYANPAAEHFYGWSCAELTRKTVCDLNTLPPEETRERMAQAGGRQRNDFEFQHRLADGSVRDVEVFSGPIEMDSGKFLFSVIHDVSWRKRAEEEHQKLEDQLRQAQRMEAVGRLAGGVAHDFNNMLSVILGYGERLVTQLHQGDPLREEAQQIVAAGRRSAALTRQLLAFSRRQALRPEVLNLNTVVKNLETMLHRLIGEDVELRLALVEDLARVLADPGQMEQVIMNLAVNARDAMPQGGKLTLETANVKLDEVYAQGHGRVLPGRYVMLVVSDTGCGMDRETLSHIFEPFFTTKEQGKGTGLGLATVYGIVEQSGGHVWAYSEQGQGATFKIYLPQTRAESELQGRQVEEAEREGGAEHILLVEDEEPLRILFARMLSGLGYRVSVAANGGEALLLVEEKGLTPDLVITDVVMPGMSGSVLVERLRRSQPSVRVLYMSGYTDNAIVHHGVLDPGTPFIQKPFNTDDIAARVRDVLQGQSRART